MKLQYNCLEDRCLILPIKKTELEKTDGGIINPNVKQKPVSEGTVVSIGEGRYASETGKLMETRLRKGDTVLYPTGGGVEITIETEEGKKDVLIFREGDILMLISKKAAE